MTLEGIYEAARRRYARPVTHADLRDAVIAACDRVLKLPTLPGDWWGEQVILETVRILEEQRRGR